MSESLSHIDIRLDLMGWKARVLAVGLLIAAGAVIYKANRPEEQTQQAQNAATTCLNTMVLKRMLGSEMNPKPCIEAHEAWVSRIPIPEEPMGS